MKTNNKVVKYAEEFAKYSPDVRPTELDDELPDRDTGFDTPNANHEAMYG